MKQQTAVDWLIQEFNNKGIDIGGGYKMSNFIPDEMIQQAKEIEKQQMKNAFHCGVFSVVKDQDESYSDGGTPVEGDPDFDEFINEFYKS